MEIRDLKCVTRIEKLGETHKELSTVVVVEFVCHFWKFSMSLT